MRTEISRNWEISVFRLVQLFLTLLVFLSTENVSLSLCLSPSCYCMMAKKNANIKRLHRIISTCRVQSIGWCFCAFIWLPAHHITSRYFFKCLCVPNSLHPTPFISDWQQKKKKSQDNGMFVIMFRQFLACSSSLLFGSVLKLTEMVRLSHIQESECVFKFFALTDTALFPDCVVWFPPTVWGWIQRQPRELCSLSTSSLLVGIMLPVYYSCVQSGGFGSVIFLKP